LVGKPGRKRTLGGPRLRWENNTKRNLLVNRTRRRGLYLCGSGGDLVAG
jgi:hypothetical protein